MRIAAGPLDGKFVQALSDQIAKQHRDLQLQLVPTAGAKDTAEAMSKDRADLAILPSNLDDSLNWPVVAILRQNVMALIVPAPVAALSKMARARPAQKPPRVPRMPSRQKPPRAARKPRARKRDKGDDSDDSSKKTAKARKVSQLAGHRVGVVTGSEATTGLLELVLSHYGVALAKVTVSEIDPKNLPTPSRTIRSTRSSSPAPPPDRPFPAR